MYEKVLKKYEAESEGVRAGIEIVTQKKAFVKEYRLRFPELGAGTRALLTHLREELLESSYLVSSDSLDPEEFAQQRKSLRQNGMELMRKLLPNETHENKELLLGILLHEMTGLGKIELLLADPYLEEIVVNNSREPAWVYHREFGWLKTDVFVFPEEQIENYANIISRRIGKQINVLTPLLDAHLLSGDRANATLFPISGKGNTLTIRRFRRNPWTISDLLAQKTLSPEILAVIWEAIQYELNIIFSGATASGKTTLLGACLPFIAPNHRMISIEDTREIQPPDFLHWVPLTTREPNAEGKGGITMLDLLVNSLRMRPDRIIVGEIRRQREAEVLFEAMHTGHSVYTTLHASTAEETIRRLTNPPIEVPPNVVESVHLNVVLFRNRRTGQRKVWELAEFIPERRGGEDTIKANSIYRWNPGNDEFLKDSKSMRIFNELEQTTGLSHQELEEDIREKSSVLKWAAEKKLNTVNEVGQMVAHYCNHREEFLEEMRRG